MHVHAFIHFLGTRAENSRRRGGKNRGQARRWSDCKYLCLYDKYIQRQKIEGESRDGWI